MRHAFMAAALLAGTSALAAEPATIYGILADEPRFDAARKDFSAKGDVALLTSEGFVTGESLQTAEGGQLLTLEGDVVVIRGTEIVRASRLVLDRRTGEFVIYGAEVVADPIVNAKSLLDTDFLGFSPEEVAFEAHRLRMIEKTRADLAAVREEFVRARNLERIKRIAARESLDLQNRYATLLERLIRTQFQLNPVFSSLTVAEQKRYETRRKSTAEMLENHPEIAAKLKSVATVGGYARFRADALYRDAEGKFRIEGASITPCRCGADGIPPLYSLSARSGLVELEGYAFLRGATLQVADVPLAYSPFMAFPVKRQRQTGFLRPYFFVSQGSRVLGLPLFVTLGRSADATLTFNDFSGRGVRYDLETRVQLAPESRLELYGELINDRKHLAESRLYQASLTKQYDAAVASDASASELEAIRERKQTPRKERWYLQGSWNVPMSAWAATKARGELASDSSYLSDFGKDEEAGSDPLGILKPAQSAKRFLLQEVSTEYYGNALTGSLRVQGARDLLLTRSGDSPVRAPKVEFHLLPRRYFDLPIAYDHVLSFERVARMNKSKFVDLTAKEAVSVPTAGDPAPAAVEMAANGRKDIDEPYLIGDRWNSEANLVVPLPANDFINASVSLNAVETLYKFPEVRPVPEIWPSQSYVRYNAGVSMPLFSELEFFSREERALEARLRHDFEPSLSLTYIPEVTRSSEFPTEHQTFYLADNVVSKQELAFGLTSGWTLFREDFVESGAGPARIPSGDPGVGNLAALDAVLSAEKFGNSAADAGYFELTRRADSTRIFRLWSSSELNAYASEVERQEFGADHVWTGPRIFKKSQRWVMRPLALGISTTYNFRAKQSERELNERERWRPGRPWTKVEPWGDVLLTAGWSLAPLLPLYGQWNNTWSVQWSRWVKSHIAAGVEAPFGLGGSFLKTDSYSPAPQSLTQEQELGYGVSYKPWSFLLLSHAWTKKRTWTDGVQIRESALQSRPTPSEFDHTDTQAISFMNLQDCLDITFKRTKDYKKREFEAIWSVGINMSFFGQRTGVIEVGDPLNREVQNRTRR